MLNNQDLITKRTITDDDDKCLVCNSGDYEDNDNIVFCDFCGMAVHQSCYGIEEVPSGDWYCISCTVLGKNKGRNLKCCLCPKYGGALKPTTVLSKDPIFIKKGTTVIHSEVVESPQKKQVKRGRPRFTKTPNGIFKCDVKGISLSQILEQERVKLGRESFLEHETNDVKEKDNTLFYLTMDSKLNYKLSKEHFTETHYAWAHLSCASFIDEISYTC